MKNFHAIALLLVAALALPLVSSCLTEGYANRGPEMQLQLCDGCGQLKGSDACCDMDAEMCSKCGLAKGAPGCCVIQKGGGAVGLCSHCGQVAGSEACCDADAPRCDGCGMAKGSPACCKI